jgi:hypothetical protein
MISKLPITFSCLLLSLSLVAQKDSAATLKVDTIRIQNLSPAKPETWYGSPAALAYGALLVSVASLVGSVYISKKSWRKNAELVAKQSNSKLHADNRQEWINKVRDCLSELLAACNKLNLSFQEETDESYFAIHNRVILHRNRLRLYLNPKLETHGRVLNDITAVVNLLDVHLNDVHPNQEFDNFQFIDRTDNAIESDRDMLYKEWERIQQSNKDYLR